MRQKIEDIDIIIIHTAETPPTFNGDISNVNAWHEQRGFSDENGNKIFVGYHFVITKDGTIQAGRPLDRVGAHTKGKNVNSVGVCWIGGADGIDDRTDAQKNSMHFLIQGLSVILPSKSLRVTGHREFSTKLCPNFEADKEYEYVKREV